MNEAGQIKQKRDEIFPSCVDQLWKYLYTVRKVVDL
jgi:hypothetical protein